MKREDMLIGVHVSIAGGLHKAFARGKEIGCTVIQVFTRNATQWKTVPLTTEMVTLFLKERSRTQLSTVAHAPYLINLASPDPELHERSVAALREEIDRTEQLEIPYLIVHPGAHKGSGEEAGMAAITGALNGLLQDSRGYRLAILLENTAGQGTSVGHRVEHLGRILDGVDETERVGVCFDTCHAFAAGYDLRNEASYQEVFEEFDRTIGLGRLRVFHLNDSKRGPGEKVDRHEHIGMGALGLDGFRRIVNDPRFVSLPMILETPKELAGKDMDPVNLSVVRSLVKV